MVVCKYFKQGNCKFGARCNFEHPRGIIVGGNNGFDNASGNKGNVFGGSINPAAQMVRVSDITAEAVKADLTTEKPQWPFTSYCPVKYGTFNLLRDQDLSFEELRVAAYDALRNNTMPAYEQQLNQKATELQSQVQAVLQNLSQAVQVAQDNNKPVSSNTALTSSFGQMNPVGNSSVLGQSTSLASNPFSISSNLGSTSAFGQPQQATSVFGQPNNTTGPFGNGSQPANNPFAQASSSQNSVFGQSSTPAAATSQASAPISAFGRPSGPSTGLGGQTQTTSAFGEPSLFGRSSANAFGQASVFGQGSQPQAAFGQSSQPTSVFGQQTPTQASTQSAFGQSSQPASFMGQPQSSQGVVPSVLSASGSGNTSTIGPTGGVFGTQSTLQNPITASTTASAFGQVTSPQSSFGKPSQPQSAFVQSSEPQSAFGQSSQPQSAIGQSTGTQSAFGQASQPQSAFGRPAGQSSTAQPTSTSAFGTSSASAAFSTPVGNASAFGLPKGQMTSAAQSAFGQTAPATSQAGPAQSAFGAKQDLGASGQGFGSTKAVEAQPAYSEMGELSEEILNQFKAEHFTIGQIPEVPPPRALIVFLPST